MNQKVKEKNKENNNSSNSLVFGRWPKTRTSDSSESFEAIIGSIGFPAEEIKNDLEKWKMSKSEPPAKSDRSNSIPANSG